MRLRGERGFRFSAFLCKSFFIFPLCLPLLGCTESAKIDLSGRWQFALDRDRVGISEQWYNKEFEEMAALPGSVVENGYGDDITTETKFRGHVYHKWYHSERYAPYREPGNIKIPSFLTPPKHYVGCAWFRRVIEIPQSWHGRLVFLSLERCNFETTVWLDGRRIGSQNSLTTPHQYELGIVEPGRHELAICVDNELSINVGVSHAVNDWIQTHWNGMIGHLELEARDAVYIKDVQVYPDLKNGSATVKVTAVNSLGGVQPCTFELEAKSFNSKQSHRAAKMRFQAVVGMQQVLEFTYDMGDSFLLWGEHTPNLYQMNVRLNSDGGSDETTAVFGMRQVDIQGKRFTINGNEVMLRGTNESGIFPLTGYTSMKVEDWRRIFRTYKTYGLNHMRFHSWCPPEAAFRAADEIGFYLQPEGPFNCSIGDGQPVDAYLKVEMTRILNTYGNHPSFVLMAHGNEPGGENKDAFLAKEVERWKSLDSRHKYTAGSGWPMVPENDFHCNHNPRLQLWGEGLMSRINSDPPGTQASFDGLFSTYDRPMVIHESGQWCVYPNFEEMSKYTGVMKPKNFEIFRDFIKLNNLGDMGRAFLMASGKLQTICYKAEIEHALRTPNCGGFQLLSLHDYPGQGSALVGVVDPFRDPKPYTTAEEFRRFCNTTVPLARFAKYVWTSNEIFTADVVATHFGPAPLRDVDVKYEFHSESGEVVRRGMWKNLDVAIGDNQPLGKIQIPGRVFDAPAKYTLVVTIQGTDFQNDWDIWVYPRQVDTKIPQDILLTESLDSKAVGRLQSGGKVLLMPDVKAIETPCKIGFGSMFWNVSFTNYQAPHTLGLLCDPDHAVFRAFPTEYHSNWQWWDLVRSSAALVIDDLPAGVKPLVQPIDNYFDARRLSLLFEARVGKGKLMVCTMDLVHDLPERPAARQLRHSIIQYMQSDAFEPSISLRAEEVQAVFSVSSSQSVLREVGARIHKASAEVEEAAAENIIDGKKDTIWLSNKQYADPRPPHSIVIDLTKEINIAGIKYVPRQDSYGGRVGDYRIYVCNDPARWGPPVVEGRWPDTDQEQSVVFPEPAKGRFLIVEAVNEVHTWGYVSIADIDIVMDWRE